MKSRLGGLLSQLSEVRIGLAMMAVALLIWYIRPPLIELASLKIFDTYFEKSPAIQRPKDVVIVAIDEKSMEKLGRWPWTRSVIADLIDRLSGFEPKVIGLDIVFHYPEVRHDLLLAQNLLGRFNESGSASDLQNAIKQAADEADVDEMLAKAFRKAGNVVPGYFFFTKPEEVEELGLNEDEDYRIIRKSRFDSYKLPRETRKAYYSGKKKFVLNNAIGAKPNIKKLTDAAQRTGFFNLWPDPDGVYRRITNVVMFHKKYFPSLAMQLLSEYAGGAKTKITFKEPEEGEFVIGVRDFKIGDTFIPSDEYGRTVINYYGPEGTFPHISIADVIEGGWPDEKLRELLKDKIVLVGATATGIYDIRQTPVGIMAGVELQATFIQNVLDGIVLRRSGWFFIFEGASILGLGLFFIIAMRWLKLFAGALLATCLLVIYWWFQQYMFVKHYTLVDIIYPIITIGLVYSGIAFYKYAVEAGERRFINKAFGHYLSPQVINQIIADPSQLELGGQEKVLTAFFTDIKGFSSFSEKMGPNDLVELLNEYLSEMTDIIQKNEGTLDKYIGDAIVAFFGAPLHYEDHAVKACRSALESQRRLVEMREKWKERNLPPLEVRIGVNTGMMLVGNMGSKQTFNYTMMGDEVNLASRLEGVNKQYGTAICISESTQKATNGEFETRELDLVRVVGRETPVRIYELMALKGELTPEQQEWRTTFLRALDLYRTQEWEKATTAFEEVNRLHDDAAARYYIRRCRRFMDIPPGTDWDGVFTLTMK